MWVLLEPEAKADESGMTQACFRALVCNQSLLCDSLSDLAVSHIVTVGTHGLCLLGV